MVLSKVGLTGSSGMLGRHLHAALQAAGAEVSAVSRSGSDGSLVWDHGEWLSMEMLDELFGEAIAVIHAGAIVDAPISDGGPHLFDVNVRVCANLAGWALRRSIPIVFVSSGSVYAEPDAGYLTESTMLGANKLGGAYGMSKLMAEDILSRYRALGLKLAIVRPSSLYGYGGPSAKLIYKLLGAALRGETIELMPPVNDRIDFLHAADLSNAIIEILRRDCWETFNIASQQPVSIYELATACIDVVGRGDLRLYESISSESAYLQRLFLDASLAREYLDWKPLIDLRYGLGMVLSGQLLAAEAFATNQTD
jgi:UDP-glucose 4-epimerase